jgi:hypothetical protein
MNIKKTIDYILKWSAAVKKHGEDNQFLALALAFGDEIKHFENNNWKSLLENRIDSKVKELSRGTNDYGEWRSRQGGNFSYEDFIAAKEGRSREVDQLRKASVEFDKLAHAIKNILPKFNSVDSLARLCHSFRTLVHDMRQPEYSNVRQSAIPKERDIWLCLAWSGVDVQTKSQVDALSLMKSKLGRYDVCRLLSARVAEIAAVDYYRSIGKSVIDISITQLENTDQSWKDFDVSADSKPLDVKNARESFSSPDTYVEHCVPRFKKERNSNKDVSIVGVLSKYHAKADIIVKDQTDCLILGQVNVKDIRSLYRWMVDRFGELLNLDGMWNVGFLPGWMYEYPPEQYRHRQSLIAQIEEVLAQMGATGFCPTKSIPGWFFVLCQNRGLAKMFDLSSRTREILVDLYSLEEKIGLTRPSLFIYSMGIILETMNAKDSSQETAHILKKLIFVDNDQSNPLGLIDTQLYIANIIDLLLRVKEEIRRQNIHFKSFKMPHPDVLRGQRMNGQWMTLIAYCGGWQKYCDGWQEKSFDVKCGTSPLFFGEHKVSSSCGRLICNNCEYCCKACHDKGINPIFN